MRVSTRSAGAIGSPSGLIAPPILFRVDQNDAIHRTDEWLMLGTGHVETFSFAYGLASGLATNPFVGSSSPRP